MCTKSLVANVKAHPVHCNESLYWYRFMCEPSRRTDKEVLYLPLIHDRAEQLKRKIQHFTPAINHCIFGINRNIRYSTTLHAALNGIYQYTSPSLRKLPKVLSGPVVVQRSGHPLYTTDGITGPPNYFMSLPPG